jgi:hypothetical protein
MGYTFALKEDFFVCYLYYNGNPLRSRFPGKRTTSPPVQSEWPKDYCVCRLKCYSHAETELHKIEYKFDKIVHASKHHMCKTMVNRKLVSVLNIDPLWKWDIKFRPGRFIPLTHRIGGWQGQTGGLDEIVSRIVCASARKQNQISSRLLIPIGYKLIFCSSWKNTTTIPYFRHDLI